MSDFLREMARGSEARAAALDPTELRARLADAPPVRPLVLGPFAVIAELKRRSPREGTLGDDGSADVRLGAYRDGGAAALSVLTEPARFGGALADLERAVRTGVPVMRKDFLVAPAQVDEARAAGASGVLLIVRLLSRDGLRRLAERAAELDMFALIEVFDEADLDRAGDASLLGVNARDLRTLGVDRSTFARLAPHLPAVPVIAESGHHTVDDVRASAALGYRGVLAGTALMRTADPARVIAAFLEAACS